MRASGKARVWETYAGLRGAGGVRARLLEAHDDVAGRDRDQRGAEGVIGPWPGMRSKAMRIERNFTKPGVSPYELVAFATTKSEIRNPDGSVVFSLEGVEVPAAWSQVAADVLAQKYFRKAGVPARLKRVEEESVPSFLWRSVPDETALSSLPKEERMGSEISAKQVFDRLAGAWAYWGWKAGYFEGQA